MENLNNYKGAEPTALIPVQIRFKDNTKEIIEIPKSELWYEAGIYSGHRSSGFMLDKALIAVKKRGYYPSGVSYPFI